MTKRTRQEKVDRASTRQEGIKAGATECRKNMAACTTAFVKSFGPSRGGRFYIGGCLFWLFLFFIIYCFWMLKIGIWICIETVLLTALTGWGLAYWINSMRLTHHRKQLHYKGAS